MVIDPSTGAAVRAKGELRETGSTERQDRLAAGVRRRHHLSATPDSAHRLPSRLTARPVGSSEGLEQAEELDVPPCEGSLTSQLVQETSLTESAHKLGIFVGNARPYPQRIFSKRSAYTVRWSGCARSGAEDGTGHFSRHLPSGSIAWLDAVAITRRPNWARQRIA